MSKVSWIGKSLNGRYQIEEMLGQGGMSAVYKATDPNLRRVVAVKMIHPHLSANPDFVRRFEEEAAAVAQLRHPNIIQVFDFTHDEGTYFMVLEFVPGETLQDRLRRLNQKDRTLEPADTAEFIAQVADALQYAHERGMVHRDIKPANIMLDVYGKAILMDFGIARIMGGQSHTATGAVVGTAMYMSPEQITGERADERSDIYSLGVTLFEALSGRPPFEADSAMTLMMMHMNDPAPDVRELRPEIPPALAAIAKKALEKKRELRFQSAAEMAAALRQATNLIRSPGIVEMGTATQSALPVENTLINDIVDQTAVDQDPQRQWTAAGRQHNPARETGSSAAQSDPRLRPPAGSQPDVPPKRKLHPAILIGGGVGVFGMVALVIVLMLALGSFSVGGDRTPTPDSAALVEQTFVAETVVAAVAALTSEAEPTQTFTPAATATARPSATYAAPTATATITLTPTATVPPGIPYVRINAVTVRDGLYVVEYETFEYTEQLPGMHVHFFFDTVKPDQAGVPGSGPWILYGGPRPFTKYRLADRPNHATQMCALVANPNHSIQPGSGNCVDLPD